MSETPNKGTVMKLAVRKEEGSIPGAGFHYNLHPIEMRNDLETEIFQRMGYIIIEVPEKKGAQLIKAACAALSHQIEVAVFADAAESIG